MSTIGSTRTRITGMSGFDTETMVRQLMNAESMKLNQLKQKSQLITWQQEAFRGVSTSLKTFQDTFLNFANMSTNFKSSTMFSALKVSVTGTKGSDLKGVSVKSTTGAQNTTATLKIDSFASKDTYVGNTLNTAVTASSAKELSGITEDSKLQIKLDGKDAVEINLKEGVFTKDGALDISALRNKLSEAVGFDNLESGKSFELILNGKSTKITLNNEDFNYTPDLDKMKSFITNAMSDALQDKNVTFEKGQSYKISLGNKAVTVTLDDRHLDNGNIKIDQVFKDLKDTDFNFDKLKYGDKFTIQQVTSKTDDTPVADGLSFNLELGVQAFGDSTVNTDKVLSDMTNALKSLNTLKQGDKFDITLDGKTKTIELDKDVFKSNGTLDIDELNKKLKTEFGSDGNTAKVSFDTNTEGALVLKTTSGHSVQISNTADTPDSETVEALGFTSGASNTTSASTQTLVDVFKGFYTFSGDSTTIQINGKDITVNEKDTIDDFVNRVNDSGAGVTMKYSKITNSFRIESNEMGSVNAINFGDSSDGFIKDALGFKDTADSRITKASDAVVWIDGKQTSRTTNTFEIAEGLEVTLDPGVNNVGDTMTIKAAPDTESTITNIKKFIEEYNNLLDNLNNLYSTRREKSSTYEYYEPLTDDQRDAMSEKDIEKWEEKAKSGLLYNDPTLGKIITDLRSWMAEGVEVGEGKKISLYDLGIDSNHWSEKGKLTIKDEDKLRKALEERPDDVAALFNKSSDTLYSDKAKRNDRMKEQGLAYRIDDIIQNSIKTSRDADGHRGTLIEKAGMKGTASDTENILHEALKEQDERILQMVQKLTDKEDYYYRMFSAMETAMNKYNSQSSWLSQQFAY